MTLLNSLKMVLNSITQFLNGKIIYPDLYSYLPGEES
jgi:hypothetical protein